MDIWSWNNAVDATGTVLDSTTGSAGGLELANLRDPRVGRVWRAGAMPVTVRVSLPATGGVSIVGLFGTNLPNVGDVTLKLIGFNGGTVWQQVVPRANRRPNAVYLIRDVHGQPDPVNAVALTITAEGIIPLDIGRIWIGGADWQPEIGHAINGSGWQIIDLTRRTVTPITGAFLMDRGERRMAFTAAYDALGPLDYAGSLITMDRERGLAGQMVFIPNPDVYTLADFAILGYIRELPENNFVGFLRAARTVTIVEAG